METNNKNTDYLEIVDDYDQAIARAPYSIVRQRALLHRGVCVIVMDNKANVLLQKRAKTKHLYPGFYCTSASGAVKEGEEYQQAALRELKEETDITAQNLQFLYKDIYKSKENNVHTSVFYCKYEGPTAPQESEVESLEWVPVQKVEEFMEENPFAPDEIIVMKRFIQDYYLKGRIA